MFDCSRVHHLYFPRPIIPRQFLFINTSRSHLALSVLSHLNPSQYSVSLFSLLVLLLCPRSRTFELSTAYGLKFCLDLF